MKINDIAIDGEYILDPQHQKTWKRIARISHAQALAWLTLAGKIGSKTNTKDPYLFLNKGFVIVPGIDNYEDPNRSDTFAVYMHDGFYSLYIKRNPAQGIY